jgi:hypothetical protein
VRGTDSVIAVGEKTVVGTTVTRAGCTAAAGFSIVTLSATRSAVLKSTVGVVADKRLADTSATLFTTASDAFFSTRTELVGDFFGG